MVIGIDRTYTPLVANLARADLVRLKETIEQILYKRSKDDEN